MTTSKIAEFAEPLDLSALCGRTITGYVQDDGYWHPSVTLVAEDAPPIVFLTAEHSAGHWFEVFPIRYVVGDLEAGTLTKALNRMTIAAAEPLWRFEWIVPGATAPTLGSTPCTQYAGRGPVPLQATSAARVLAGVLLLDATGHRVVVASSDSAPFDVEIAHEPVAVEVMLKGFEPR